MTTERKIVVIDSEIPFIQGLFEPYADVRYLRRNEINRRALEDADGVIIRTGTRCTPALLEGTKVSFIGTATVGTDHIDMGYCARSGITVASAAGCNAFAVAQYVLCALLSIASKQGKKLKSMTMGIIGVGNIG
ncbi:MAG: 4-phosphoerythronate dehydrogenase, partial [Prevotellaceae bacterium]|nr:4-phosphoerythronate dehydrogenase [Prevotellaceae bacterium]